jgi:serine/threonine-protein kinase
MAAMLFSADEVASGAINHAIRFILPNSRHARAASTCVRRRTPAGRPAGRACRRTACASGYAPTIPLARCRPKGARVIARAMQRYGMILSDGGNIALTAQSDRFTTHKWSEVGVD